MSGISKLQNNKSTFIKPFRGTRSLEIDVEKNTDHHVQYKNKNCIKGLKGNLNHSSGRIQLKRCHPSELMNRLEQFSEVWNDCPIVQHSKLNCESHFDGYEDNNTIKKDGLQENKQQQKTCLVEKSHIPSQDRQKQKNNRTDVNKTDFVPEYLKNQNINLVNRSFSKNKVFYDDSFKSSTNLLAKINQEQSNKYDSKSADMKRKKALQEQSKLQADKKNIIKQALSSVDRKQLVNKKIVFSDTKDFDGRDGGGETQEIEPSKRQQLFNEDNNDELSDSDHVLKLNKQFEGEKGQKLLKLQNKFANDPRFTLDRRFNESDSEENEKTETDSLEEKKKQLAILESVVKKQIKPLSEFEKLFKKNEETLLLRFDPTRGDHSKYIVRSEEILKNAEESQRTGDKKVKKNKKEILQKNPVPEAKPEVSNEKFYCVKEDLKEVLKNDSKTEFSLLNMFGPKEVTKVNEAEEKEHQIKKVKYAPKNPFKYDSSESESEEKKVNEGRTIKPSTAPWKTFFFFTEKDSRLREAFDFLKESEEMEANQDYAEKRKLLKDFIKHKFKNNNRKKSLFKKKLGGVKKRVFKKRIKI